MKLLALAGFAALAVGCAASSDDSASSSNAVTAATPGTATAAAADPDYLAFNTRAEADVWYEAHKQMILGANAPAPAPESDPRAVRIQAIIDSHWPTIQQKYGVTMHAPFPLIIDTQDVNAFALYDPTSHAIPDVIFVLAGILTQTDDDLTAVLGHEMGHMITKNAMPSYGQAVNKFYNAGPTEQLGINAVEDDNVANFIVPYLDGVQVAGPLDNAEILGLPLFGGVLTQLFSQYYKQHAVTTDAKCHDFAVKMNALQNTMIPHITQDGADLDLDASSLPTLSADIQAAQTAAIACLHPAASPDFPTLFQQTFGASLDEIDISSRQIQAITGRDAITGLFATMQDSRAIMRAVDSDPAFPGTRQYTVEEQADDFSMTILNAEGKDPAMMGRSVLKLGDQPSIDACNAILATDKVPTYGISDIHHSNCYRAYHSNAFKAYLDAGGPGVLPVTAPVNFDRMQFNPLKDRIIFD